MAARGRRYTPWGGAAAIVVSAAVWMTVPAAPVGAQEVAAHQNISKAAAAKQYLALVAPVNAVTARFSAEAAGWTDSTMMTQATADANPVVTAFQQLNRGLRHDRWPSGARSAINSLVTADGPVLRDLQGLASLPVLNPTSFISSFEHDAAGVGTAVRHIRHDLGLPPAKS